MKTLRKILKWTLYLLAIPLLYLLLSLLLSTFTCNKDRVQIASGNTIFLTTNGVHLDIVLSKGDMSAELSDNLIFESKDEYIAFGWGDKDFYLNTPTWSDLTFTTAFKAIFLKNPSLMHITRYYRKQRDWIPIELSDSELEKLNQYLLSTFKANSRGEKIHLEGKGYSTRDDFYLAKGNYSCLYTCNTWVNTGFKEVGLRSCYWTPFDFGLLNKYK